MNFLLPRFALLLVMLLASAWALLDRTDSQDGDSITACSVDAPVSPGEVGSGLDSVAGPRQIRWQSFLPGTLR